jgi:hypothetical protein
MLDDLDTLQEDARLLRLLEHYAQAGTADREAWQDRVMELPGLPAEALVKLHGRLLACEWLEQNTGATPVLQRGAVPRCYRITSAGQRALKRAHFRREPDDVTEAEGGGEENAHDDPHAHAGR